MEWGKILQYKKKNITLLSINRMVPDESTRWKIGSQKAQETMD